MATMTQPAAANGSQQPLYTCNTCGVAFRTGELQRTHMQSDWHRYNLKRRVAQLPPLTAEAFSERVIANKATAAATAARARFEKRCEACEKTFYSEGAHSNHLGSQKHRILAARWNAGGTGTETESLVDSTFSLGEPMEAQSTTTESTVNGEANGVVDEDAEEEFENVVDKIRTTGLEDASPQDPLSARPGRPTPTTAQVERDHPMSPEKTMDGEEYDHKADVKQCLFCNYDSPTLDLNINHMGKQHGFFIPEREFLVDLEGLVNYLSETIQVLNTCLFCHKTLHSAHGIQTHMRDRGHCMIAYATEDEQMDVGEFYDFRSTYSDEEIEEEDEEVDGGVKLGVKRATKTTVQNGDGQDVDMDGDEEGWESDSTLSSVPTDEITSVPIENKDHKYAKLDLHRHHSHSDPRPHKNTDGFHSHAHHTPTAVYHDDYELHLPSGRTAGHRALRTYYRQNLRNYPTPEEREQQRLLTESDERHVSDDENDAASETTETGRGRQVVTRANGGLGMIGVSDAKKREVRAVEKRDQKRAQRAENRYRAGNERRHNFQKHFRDPLLQ
ncbi:pre-60S factor rei1 [Saxophila tyrrhenica]|uniref:Pre-60S factor rei1 n=1 Tax=Saxophila tyrrhenica TaxID=1690608 RepID=A0AAV9P3D7_9PEZI|nr:pre-60S factor rei1 [Saxophila tyrrhenica]